MKIFWKLRALLYQVLGKNTTLYVYLQGNQTPIKVKHVVSWEFGLRESYRIEVSKGLYNSVVILDPKQIVAVTRK